MRLLRTVIAVRFFRASMILLLTGYRIAPWLAPGNVEVARREVDVCG